MQVPHTTAAQLMEDVTESFDSGAYETSLKGKVLVARIVSGDFGRKYT